MLCIEGTSIFSGIAIGRLSIYDKEQEQVKRCHIEDKEAEIERYEQAKKAAIEQLHELYERAVGEVGEVNAQVFEVNAMMLEDEDYNDSIYHMIETQSINAEYAVARTGANFAQMFAEMDDEYFKARSADVKDISERVVGVLMGAEHKEIQEEEPAIILAKELTPGETIQMDKEKVLSFVTEIGSKNSHTAILARSMNIPALVGISIESQWDGKMGIVDGYHGRLYVEPDEETLSEMQMRLEENKKKQDLLQRLKDKETISRSGKKIHLYANIGNKSDIAGVIANDAEGIGLFRTEFLYLESETFPTEQEQFLVYQYVAEAMAGKKVIIRTLDIGADKQADYFQLEHEENPAMGYRAIRICLEQRDIFKTQLRAILRAAAYGNISVMFPMIISLDEVRQAKAVLEEARKELEAEGIGYGNVEIGIMIETPAAVVMSDVLAAEVEFFSIGTNDLTQYTLAMDRQNQKLDKIYDPHHPAVLRMIKHIIQSGHSGGAWVGICGELGADMELTQTFLDMGVDELSVSPGMVLPVRQAVLDCS